MDRRQLLASLGTLAVATVLPRTGTAAPDDLEQRAYVRVRMARKLTEHCPRVRDYGRNPRYPNCVDLDENRIEHTAFVLMHMKDDVAERFERFLDGAASMIERCAHCDERATSLVVVGTLADTDHYRYGNPLRCAAHITTKLDDLATVTDLGDGTTLWSYDHATNYFFTPRGIIGVGSRILKRSQSPS